MFISEAFAQAAPAATGADSPFGTLGTMLPLVLMFVVLYFVMIRPQMKRQKEHKAMVEALAKGDEVVTSGGVLGRVSKMGDTFIGVEVVFHLGLDWALDAWWASDGSDPATRPPLNAGGTWLTGFLIGTGAGWFVSTRFGED